MPKPLILHTLKRTVISGLLLLSLTQFGIAQPAPEPEREQLLNGLNILFWPRPGSPDVLVKMRIHSGAAFDLAGKAGEMALLGDILFPDPATYDFFSTEMGGRLSVNVNYDSIVITMSGKAEEFEQIIQVLRTALISTQLTPEVVTRIKDARMKILRDTAVSPTVVADRAISARLFGSTFPYGRPIGGSPEDLARVDRADLMLARERFLNSNNATLAIVGGVARARTLRTLRQLIGPWRKSEQLIPTTFKQPVAADHRALIINSPGPSSEVRVAVRGVSRNDTDYFTSLVLAKLALQRWVGLAPELANKPVFARSDSYVLPGMFVIGGSINNQNIADSMAAIHKTAASLLSTPATAAELERAKSEVINEVASLSSKPESMPDPWFDVVTYGLKSVQNHQQTLQSINSTDLQRLANRLFKDGSVATVIVGDSMEVKAALDGKAQFEVLGEIPTPVITTPVITAPAAVPSPSPKTPVTPKRDKPR
jgi:zinc protease